MSKKSLTETIQHNGRFFAYLDSNMRHLRNYDDLREYLKDEHPGVYDDWLLELSAAGA